MTETTRTTAKQWQVLNGTAIKSIAMVLMVLDHIHQMYAADGAPLWLTMLGRPVFPMFLFIAADSFYYTKNRGGYLKRLLFASWGMTAITALVSMLLPNPDVVLMNNAFSTFFVTGIYVQAWDWLVRGIRDRKITLIGKCLLAGLVPILCTAPLLAVGALSLHAQIPFVLVRVLALASLLLPNIMTVEGGPLMVLLGLLFYVFRKRRALQILILLLASCVVFVLSRGGIQWLMCGAAIPMLLYNGERGAGRKQLFYLFYPAHIILLYVCATALPI